MKMLNTGLKFIQSSNEVSEISLELIQWSIYHCNKLEALSIYSFIASLHFNASGALWECVQISRRLYRKATLALMHHKNICDTLQQERLGKPIQIQKHFARQKIKRVNKMWNELSKNLTN